MPTATLDPTDPMPEPPSEPDLDACCGNGCDPCIFDLHELEMERRGGSGCWNTELASISGALRV